jgi:hypothetical protein
MKKPGLPSEPKDRFNRSVRETLEIITGQRGEKIKPLDDDASLSDVIEKINEILNVLQ